MKSDAYSDDKQIYDLDKDPVRSEERLQCHVLKANHWFGVNGTISNPDKYQAMVLAIVFVLAIVLIVFFLVMLDFPFPSLKLFTIVNSFLSLDIYLVFN